MIVISHDEDATVISDSEEAVGGGMKIEGGGVRGVRGGVGGVCVQINL
jgi:hypothetical protein